MRQKSHKDKSEQGSNGWLKLDNAAKIYPPVTRGELTGVFRLTAILAGPVHFDALSRAVTETYRLFPTFSAELCSGIFWYYLEQNGKPPRILLDEGPKCQAFPKSKKGEVMYRILARDNRISAEFLHIITDGGGAMMFFKTLLNNYAEKVSGEGNDCHVFPDINISTPITDSRDLFREFSKKKFPHPVKLAGAWHLPFALREKPRFRSMSFSIPSDALQEAARSCNATVTEFLAAVYLASLQDLRNRDGKGPRYLRVQVPVDLRRRFNAETVRNFSVFVMPELDLRMGSYSFEEIIQEVRIAIGLMANDKRLTKIISRNVSKENNSLIRIAPLPVKRFFLRLAYNRLGISQYSGVLTNLGRVGNSPGATSLVKGMLIVPPPSHRKIKVSCGVASFGNNTIITFGSITEDRSLEKSFISCLTGRKIPVKFLNSD